VKIDVEKEIKEVEERIIEWAKLISDSTPGQTRLRIRIEMIDHVIQERKGLMGLLARGGR
jgi:hypothetical protein